MEVQSEPRRARALRLSVVGFAALLALPAAAQNVLLVLADDIGVDKIGAYAPTGENLPRTPVIDGLARRGVRFTNAWSAPVCSPTRAMVQTGRYGFRTGVGWVVALEEEFSLPDEELFLPEALERWAPAPYASALIGKWHLGSASGPAELAPNLAGYDHFAGALQNLEDYFAWPRTVNGTTELSRTYATTQQVDDAIAWIRSRGEAPWFCLLSPSAAHGPFHAPPEALHAHDLAPVAGPAPSYAAAVEALDRELGRLLDAIDPARTTVVFAADNGTPKPATQAPFVSSHAKGTLYEGGLRVPLIVSGPEVVEPGRSVAALVDLTDLYTTVLELAGVPADTLEREAGVVLDSVSLVPYLRRPGSPALREFVYAERFEANGFETHDLYRQALRVGDWKLIRNAVNGVEQLYRLDLDPFEQDDLLAQSPAAHVQSRRDRMAATLDELTGPLELPNPGGGIFGEL